MAVQVSACLIVKDEEARLGRCLSTVAPLVDEVVVADTGSTDATVAIAEQFGARVVAVPWTDDFAAARNAAHEACRYDWVLSVDADEQAVGVRPWLRAMLAELDGHVSAATVRIDQLGTFNAHSVLSDRRPKLYRRDLCHWQGRVHESLVHSHGISAGMPVLAPALPEGTLRLLHDGYIDEGRVREKLRGYLRLAELNVADVVAAGGTLAQRNAALVDLGRSQYGLDLAAPARATFEEIRSASQPGEQVWWYATDFLAWLALRVGDTDAAWSFAQELEAAGAPEEMLGKLRPLLGG